MFVLTLTYLGLHLIGGNVLWYRIVTLVNVIKRVPWGHLRLFAIILELSLFSRYCQTICQSLQAIIIIIIIIRRRRRRRRIRIRITLIIIIIIITTKL